MVEKVLEVEVMEATDVMGAMEELYEAVEMVVCYGTHGKPRNQI
jgi:hypothetical protein